VLPQRGQSSLSQHIGKAIALGVIGYIGWSLLPKEWKEETKRIAKEAAISAIRKILL